MLILVLALLVAVMRRDKEYSVYGYKTCLTYYTWLLVCTAFDPIGKGEVALLNPACNLTQKCHCIRLAGTWLQEYPHLRVTEH